MGDIIKTAVEIAMEKAALLEDLTVEEKEGISAKKKIEPLMSEFYKNTITPEKLWEKLKNENPLMLTAAQKNLLESLRFGLNRGELSRRLKGIIALESLKKEPVTSLLEQSTKILENLQSKAENEKKQVFEQFKKAIESNPQARSRVVEQGGSKIILKLSVEDAISQNPQWKQFLTDYENNYKNEFSQVIEQLKKYIK